MERETFIFHKDWFDSLDGFEESIKLKIIGAIVEYALYGKLPTDNTILYSPFAMIRKLIDRDNEKYQAICLRNQQNGIKGGRPKKDNPKEPTETQRNPKNPVGYLETQQNPKEPTETQRNPKNLDTDTYTNTDTITNTETYNNSSKELFSEPKGSSSTDVAVDPQKNQKETIFSEIVREFNLAMRGKMIPQIQKLTDKRRSAVNARISEYGKQAVLDVIRNASQSNFLNGDNDRGWKADFDWIFKPNNFPKVLEGNYNNAKQHNITATSGYANTADAEREQRNDEFLRHLYQKNNGSAEDDYIPLW